MAHFKIIAGPVKQRQSLLEVIGEERHAKQICGRTLIMSPRGFRTQFVPIVDRAVVEINAPPHMPWATILWNMSLLANTSSTWAGLTSPDMIAKSSMSLYVSVRVRLA